MTDPDIDPADKEGRELVGRLFPKPQPSDDPAVIFGRHPDTTDHDEENNQ